MDLLERGILRILAEQGVKSHRLLGARLVALVLPGGYRLGGCDDHLALVTVLASFVRDVNNRHVLRAQDDGQEGCQGVFHDQYSDYPESEQLCPDVEGCWSVAVALPRLSCLVWRSLRLDDYAAVR